MKTRTKQASGFTLIELLVVIAIIAMLIGLLSAGLRKTKIVSWNLRQKSVFHAMEIGLELFDKDFEDYPISKVLPNATDADQVCGAQHLVEALVGRDEEGVEPRTNWYAPDPTRYNAIPQLTDLAYGYYDSTNAKSRDRRKGPYGEYNHIEVWTIYDLWQGNNGASLIYDSQSAGTNEALRAPVFTDTFRRYKINHPTQGSIRVGMPILYFRANPSASRQFRLNLTALTEVTNPAQVDMDNWTYNYLDNRAVINLPSLDDPALGTVPAHYVDPADTAGTKTKEQVFYELITQRAEPSRPYFKPFNANTFLLISAGWDGVYGTKDDVTNFNY